MLSRARKYAECGATASPLQQRRTPVSTKPSPFRLLLFKISKQLVEEDLENLKALVQDYGQEDDKGILTAKQLQEITTMYSLLMALAGKHYIQPHDLSNLVTFLEMSGRHDLVTTEIEDFQRKQENSPPPATHRRIHTKFDVSTHQECIQLGGLSDHLERVHFESPPFTSSPNLTTNEQPGYGHQKQSSDPSQHAEAKPEQPTDDEGQMGIAPLGVARQQQRIIPYSLAVVQVNIPVRLQQAMKCIVIGHYVDVFRSIYSHFVDVVKRHTRIFVRPFTEFNVEDSVVLNFGLGTQQHLPIQALNHPAFLRSENYESILQLIMEAVLMAPNSKENLDKLLHYPNLHIPESLKLLYRSRLPSVATDEELREELASQSQHLADWLRGEQQQADFAASKTTLYLAQVYDATAYINRHQQSADFRAVFMQKADFHERAMQERQNYEPRTDLEKAVLKLESTRSAQSRGYAYAEMATNGPEHPKIRREHAEMARSLHEEAINDHATPLLELLHMREGMSEGAALVANLRFDQMLRILRTAQLDYQLHSREWSEAEKERKLEHHLALIKNEFDQIRELLSSQSTALPVLQDLLEKMEESMVPLKENVARGCVKGFALNDPTMNE